MSAILGGTFAGQAPLRVERSEEVGFAKEFLRWIDSRFMLQPTSPAGPCGFFRVLKRG